MSTADLLACLERLGVTSFGQPPTASGAVPTDWRRALEQMSDYQRRLVHAIAHASYGAGQEAAS